MFLFCDILPYNTPCLCYFIFIFHLILFPAMLLFCLMQELFVFFALQLLRHVILQF